MTTLHTEITPVNPNGFVADIIAKQDRYNDLHRRYDPPSNKREAGLRYIFLKASDQVAHDLQQAQGNFFQKFQARLNSFDHAYQHADKAAQLLTIIEKLEPYVQDFVGTDAHPIDDDRDRNTVTTAYWHAVAEHDDLIAQVYRCTRKDESYGSTRGVGTQIPITYEIPPHSRGKALEIVREVEADPTPRKGIFSRYRDSINLKVEIGEYLRDPSAVSALLNFLEGQPDFAREHERLKTYAGRLNLETDQAVRILRPDNDLKKAVEEDLYHIGQTINFVEIPGISQNEQSHAGDVFSSHLEAVYRHKHHEDFFGEFAQEIVRISNYYDWLSDDRVPFSNDIDGDDKFADLIKLGRLHQRTAEYYLDQLCVSASTVQKWGDGRSRPSRFVGSRIVQDIESIVIDQITKDLEKIGQKYDLDKLDSVFGSGPSLDPA